MPNAEITKKHIAETMKQLMEKQPLSKISVGDIAEACGISRNSFYYHFQDKFDLVNWIFYTDITKEMVSDEILSANSWDIVEAMCRFFYRHRKFYQNAISVQGQNSFPEYFQELLKSYILARADDMFEDVENKDFYIAFFLDALTLSIFRWLQGGAEIPPEAFAEMIKTAARGTAVRILEIPDPA